ALSTRPPPAKLDGDADSQPAAELVALGRLRLATVAKEHWAATARWLRKFDKATDDVYAAVEKHAAKEPRPNLIDVFAAESGRGGDVHFLIRGEVDREREVAKPGFIQVLMNAPERDRRWLGKAAAKPLDPRVGLANWITDAEHGAG